MKLPIHSATSVLLLLATMISLPTTAMAQDEPIVIPERDEGEGPFDRLILRGAFMIDGTGAPTQGPVDIVVENDRITAVKVVGNPKLEIDPQRRPPLDGARELDISGMYILPGFIDTHMHLHSQRSGQNVPPDYVLKLWFSHGVTSGRTVGGDNGTPWEVEVAQKLADNELTGPRIKVFPSFSAREAGSIDTAEKARKRIRDIKRMGGAGVKFLGAPEDIMIAALDEARKLGMNSTMHHAQLAVKHSNVLTTSARGLRSMEHWYGLPEAMFEDRSLQHYPNDYVYNNEQHRFGEAGKLWEQAAEPGSDKWNEVMQTLLSRDFALSPTFTAYLTSRDFMRMSRAKWHEKYTMPELWDFYRPNRDAHGSYWFYWTLEDEIEWKNNFRLWMTFVNEYKNKGGKVSVGSDAGYIYNLYGFGYIIEMHLLREAGFTPLEVIHAATLVGAQVVGIDDEVGSIEVGKKADFVVVRENPLANLHVLFATGTIRLNDETREVERVGGIRYTIKDGIIYDTPEMLKEIRDMVRKQKQSRGIPEGPMPIETVPFENW